MHTKLIDHIRLRIPSLGNKEAGLIAESFDFRQLKSKDFFLNSGDVCRTAGFVLKGCLRNYTTSFEGKEVNSQFSFENWWIGDIGSFVNHTPSKVNVQAIEDCELLIITAKKYESLLDKSPSFSKYTYQLRSLAHQSAVLRFSNLSENAETKYNILIQKFPLIETRISQKHIASYLQISPEALSRLKRELREKS